MKLRGVRCFVLLSVFGVVLSIRVPNEWPKLYPTNSPPYLRTLPPRYTSVKTVDDAFSYPSTAYGYPVQKSKHFNAPLTVGNSNSGGWIPILPNRNAIVRTQYKYPTKDYCKRNDIGVTNNSYKPKKTSAYKVHGNSVSISSEHELPQYIPTRPVYPGEGQWGKRGRKYKPYSRTDVPVKKLRQEYERGRIDGYDTFAKGKKNFNKARNNFNREFNKKSKLPYSKQQSSEAPPSDSEQFVPMKLYTQVRRSEKEVHVPKGSDGEDLRLRKVVKDSRIQTVYTEEGYEDGAYDHAGHIKEAESEEERKRFDNKTQRNRGEKYTANNAGQTADESRYREVEDDNGKSYRTTNNNRDKYGSSADNSDGKKAKATEGKTSNNKSWRKAQMVKDTKKLTVKNMANGDMNVEIFSEVKVMTSPTKENETHKFVKITPKKKSVKSKAPLVHKFAITDKPTDTSDSSHLIQKRSALDDRSTANNDGNSDRKYPYYKLNDVKSLDRNSALRYSEDMANIPNKKSGEMSFYNSRPNVECPEVDDSVDPIPDHVKNADEDSDIAEMSQANAGGQRLKGLGDKIDCFKAKYFGEDPLDSPLFKEEKIVLSVPDIFAQHFKMKNKSEYVKAALKAHEEDDYDEDVEYDDDADKSSEENVQETALPSTSGKSKKLPNNIYDQIDADNMVQTSKTTRPANANKVTRKAKEYIPDADEISAEDYDETETTTISADDVTPQENSTLDAMGKPLPLVSNRRQSNYIRDPSKPGRIRPVKPKRKLHHQLSEVQYKDDIKPSEQLHVLSDVLRNIQNSTGELIQTPFPYPPVHRSTSKPRNKHRRRRIKFVPTPTYAFQDAEAILDTDLNLGEIDNDQFKYIRPPLAKPATTTTPDYKALLDSFGSETLHVEEVKPKAHVKQYPNVYKNHKESTEIYDGYLSEAKPEQEIVPSVAVNAVMEENEIIGLVPPSRIDYRTIVSLPSSMLYSVLSGAAHNYFIPGMKPPERKPIYESNNLKRNGIVYHRRAKRWAKNKEIMYTEIRRNNRKPFQFRDATTEASEAINQAEIDDAPGESVNNDYEDEEIIVATTPLSTTTTTTTEGPSTKSFLEYVAQLKTDKEYVHIPEPTTTERDATTTTVKSLVSTTTGKPPEFLSFVSKLKESDSYVNIPEKKVTATTIKTVAEEESDIDGDDDELTESVVNKGPVQNSRIQPSFSITEPSKITAEGGEYVPKAKSYVISSIDTSKYKTIDRSSAGVPTPARHGLSSRYNAGKDDIASGEMNTVRIPMLSRRRRPGSSSGASESDELELVEEENINKQPTTKKSVSTTAEAATAAVLTEETLANISVETTTARSGGGSSRRRMWVRTQKRASTTASSTPPDVTTTTVPPHRRRGGRMRIRSTTESPAATVRKRHVLQNRSLRETDAEAVPPKWGTL